MALCDGNVATPQAAAYDTLLTLPCLAGDAVERWLCHTAPAAAYRLQGARGKQATVGTPCVGGSALLQQGILASSIRSSAEHDVA